MSTQRNRNTNTNGSSFSSQTKLSVWQKARLRTHDGQYRFDTCGATIQWSEYGKTSKYGWEIDHIRPVASRGGDNLGNLQALHWGNNRHKADKTDDRYCVVTT